MAGGSLHKLVFGHMVTRRASTEYHNTRKEIKFINRFLYDPNVQKVKSRKIPNPMKAVLLRVARLRTGQ